MSVVIIDYGSGNIASVLNMVRKEGGAAKISREPDDVLAASKLILPGVGAFDHGIELLKEHNLFEPIQQRASEGAPLLGICLGMQLLGGSSEEGKHRGLGLVEATFKRFSFDDHAADSLRVPHVGWNQVKVVKPNPLIADDGAEQRFYFTHSYYAECSDESDVLATTEYGPAFVAAYSRGNVFGVQFHPEKSHRFGMTLLRNFLQL